LHRASQVVALAGTVAGTLDRARACAIRIGDSRASAVPAVELRLHPAHVRIMEWPVSERRNDDEATPAAPEVVAIGRAAFPDVDVEARRFDAYVAERTPAGMTFSAWARTACIEDLYLACACLDGKPAAFRAFDARFGAEIDRVLRGLDRRGLQDDAKQILMQRMFVAAPGATAKIATYTGRGPLRRWLRVATTRILLELVNPKEAPADDWAIAALPDDRDDPELAYLKARYRAAFKAAFADALARLDDRQRTLLAQYHVDHLTIDDLGALYDVHRVTAARWVAQAQVELRATIVELLREQLGLSTADLAAVTRLVRSQLSLSLVRALPGKRKKPTARRG
jgi:RNA polymerase sigma-70 factor (ECF subfamily)